MHLGVRETDDPIPPPIQPPGSVCVACGTLGVSVAIDFDNQPGAGAEEVHDVTADRLLAAELEAFQLTVTKMTPQFPLRRSLFTAKSGGMASCSRIDSGIVGHGSPSPYPLPQGERKQEGANSTPHPTLSLKGRGDKKEPTAPLTLPSPSRGEG